MKGKEIVYFSGYHFAMRYVTNYLDSSNLYYFLDAILIGALGIYLFNKSEKSVAYLFALMFVLILSANQIIYTLLDMIGLHPSAYITILLNTFIIIDIFTLIFKNRYDWKKLKSDKYDPNKIQAIYSKPNTILLLLGATASLSPKCSVRFSYGGKTIRFKKDSSVPVLVDTAIKNTDIIENINRDGDYFNNRWLEIKDKKYNLFNFNCRSLIKKN